MTPELVVYYRAMLRVGVGDAFYQAFNLALEEENPLSDLILSLCSCISDADAVVHILTEYLFEHKADDQEVYKLVVTDLMERVASGEVTRQNVVAVLDEIAHTLDKCMERPWCYCVHLADHFDLCKDGMISENVFNLCFDAWFKHGQWLDVWELHREEVAQ